MDSVGERVRPPPDMTYGSVAVPSHPWIWTMVTEQMNTRDYSPSSWRICATTVQCYASYGRAGSAKRGFARGSASKRYAVTWTKNTIPRTTLSGGSSS